jgi:hypothetical protein
MPVFHTRRDVLASRLHLNCRENQVPTPTATPRNRTSSHKAATKQPLNSNDLSQSLNFNLEEIPRRLNFLKIHFFDRYRQPDNESSPLVQVCGETDTALVRINDGL